MDEALESNGQWDVVSSSSSALTETVETKVRFSIHMKRKPLFVLMNVIIPIILLSILNIFTFKIPSDSGERMGYTITVWLAFAVFLTIVSASLPQSSDTTPIVAIYIMVQLGVGTLTVLISAVQSRIVCRPEDKPLSSWVHKLATCMRRPKIGPQKNDSTEKRNEQDIVWKDFIAA